MTSLASLCTYPMKTGGTITIAMVGNTGTYLEIDVQLVGALFAM